MAKVITLRTFKAALLGKYKEYHEKNKRKFTLKGITEIYI